MTDSLLAQGWKEIRNRLASIKHIMQDVNEQTDFIARAASGRTTTRASRIYDDRYDPDLARQAVQRISKSLPKRRRFFWALTDRAADLPGLNVFVFWVVRVRGGDEQVLLVPRLHKEV